MVKKIINLLKSLFCNNTPVEDPSSSPRSTYYWDWVEEPKMRDYVEYDPELVVEGNGDYYWSAQMVSDKIIIVKMYMSQMAYTHNGDEVNYAELYPNFYKIFANIIVPALKAKVDIVGIDYDSDTACYEREWYKETSSSSSIQYKIDEVNHYPISKLVGYNDGTYTLGGGQTSHDFDSDIAEMSGYFEFSCKLL